MKKFVSMIMAAAMIFALAVPAFAAESTASVKATMQSPKIAMTAGKVAVVANPYRIKVKLGTQENIKDQIVNAPVAFVNKSDTGLDIAIVVTPAKTNNVTFAPLATVTDEDGFFDPTDNTNSTAIPGAYLKIDALFKGDEAYSATSAPVAADFTGANCYTVEVDGTPDVTDKGVVDTDSTKNLSYSKVAQDEDKASTLTLVAPNDTSVGNAVWVRVTGALNTNLDWTTWQDSAKKPANLEFSIAFIMTPHANDADPVTPADPAGG